MKRKLLPVLTLLVACPTAAEELSGDDTAEEKRILEEVVVEASRAGITALDIPVNTSILARQDVEEFATRSTDEILRQIPGFSLLRAADSIAAAPSTATVSLRGLGGSAASRTLVLLDGIPIHSPITSEVYWARVPKHQIERIEVVRGGGANAWGNLSLGGVINIVTRKPRKNGLDFTGILSYPWTADLSVDGSQVTDRWELSGQASYFDTDGYYNSLPEQRGAADERTRKNYSTASGKATYLLNDRTRLFVTGSLFDEDRNAGSAKDINSSEIWTVGAGLELDTESGGHWRVNLFHEEMDLEDYSTRFSSDRDEEFVRGLRVQPTSATGTGLVWSHRFGKHEITAGADYRWTEVVINDYGRYLNEMARELKVTDASQDMGGVFIQDTWRISERWQVNGSLRYDYVTNQGDVEVTDLTNGQIVENESYPSNAETTVNPSLGIRYRLNQDISLRAAVYKGFRAPTLRELYRVSSTRGGVVLVNNPYLAPERLVGVEAGVDWAVSNRSFLRLTLFQNVVEDLIQNITRGSAGDEPVYIEPCGWMEPGTTCRELDNVGEMESTGLELEAGYDTGNNWSFFLSYLYNDATYTKAPDNPQIVGKQVRQAPKHSFTARARHSGKWFDTSILARYAGKRYEDEINTLYVDDFLLFDLRFAHRLNETSELFLSVENLFDEDYEVSRNSAGIVDIGRPRFIGLGWRFRK